MDSFSSYRNSHVLVVLLAVLVFLSAAVSGEPYRDWRNGILRFSEGNETARTEGINDSPRFDLIIDVTKALHITSPRYLSITISGGQMSKGLEGFDFKAPKLRNIAAGLAPSYVRFGGTLADFLDFEPYGEDSFSFKFSPTYRDSSKEDELFVSRANYGNLKLRKRRIRENGKKKLPRTFTISGTRWDNITRWCDSAGWDIMWDFNLLHFKRGRWDPTYARRFLKYSASRGVRIPAFQLGNEPNLYRNKFDLDIRGNQLAQDFWTLKDVLSEIPAYDNSGIYGPDVTNLDQHRSARTYLTQFLKNQGCDAITEVSLHHYYLKGDEAKLKDFTDPHVMDGLRIQLEYAYNISWANCRVRKPVRLSETSTATGGGIEGITNAFVAGFLWLDKLGLSATFGVTHIFRQTFFASNYALISREMDPFPDYYLSVVYKRLVEGPVFKVLIATETPLVRVYAHCVSKRYYKYPDGAMVVYYLNMAKETAHLNAASQFQSTMSNNGGQVDLFVFTPGDNDGLLSKKVRLNGQVLEMDNDMLPKMEPQRHVGDVPLTPQSFGFVVIPYAEVPLCKYYHRSENV